jgi:UDP-glucuronate decarboxylase
MRHLVTGGAGFVGSHLCDRLIAQGDDVIALDNFFTGNRRNVEHLLSHPRFELVRGDVCDPMHFEVDRIWHLACPASPVHYQRNPARTIETGVLGTLHALELARNVGARVFIASTSEVYGDPTQHPQTEAYWGNVNPIGPRACYDEAKRCGEALAASWAAQYGVEVRIARIFNTYGPRMAENDGRVVSNFICQALRGEPLTVFGDGLQTRSFCYVDDLIEGFLRLMEMKHTPTPPGADYGMRMVTTNPAQMPVNLGNPGEFTMKELADLVIASIGGNVVYRQLPKDDPTRRRPDITRARELLGWEPRIPLAEGLARTIEYFQGAIRKAA